MALDRSGDYMKPAFRVGAAALGSFLAGPLGCATGAFLGGMLGDIFGQSAAALVATCAEKFGEAAAEKILGSQLDSFAERFKQHEHPQIEALYREAFRESLIAIHHDVGKEFEDWFQNWSACLDSHEPLDIGMINRAEIVPDKLESNLSRTMLRLDRQGHALRVKDLSIIADQDRPLPPELLTEIETRLPEHFKIHFRALIVTDQYKQAWNEAELDIREYALSLLESIKADIAQLATASSASHTKTESTLDALGHELTAIKTVVEGQVALLQRIAESKEYKDLSPEPRDRLFSALKRFVESDDPRESSIAELAGSRRFDEAGEVAFELARDDESVLNRLDASTDEVRKRVAQRWIEAGDIAVVTDHAKAADAYKRAVALDPTALAGWWQLGFTSLSLDRLAEALSAFTTLCDSMDGFVKLARAAADPEAAKQDLERFLKEMPDSSPAVYVSATHRLVEIFTYIVEILKREPKLGCDWRFKVSDLDAEIDENGKFDSRNPDEEEVQGIAEKMSKDVSAFDGVLGEGAVRTEYSRALETLARMAGDLGHLDLAQGYLDRAHRMSVEGADLVAEAVYLCNLGVVAGKMGQLNIAEDYLNRALAICQDDPTIGVRMIFARAPMSPEEAEQWKDHPRAEKDGLRDDEIVLCNRLEKESEHDPESAFRKGMKLRETEGNVHGNLAIVAWKQGDVVKADQEFGRAFDVHREIAFLPGLAQDLASYGDFAWDQGDTVNASVYWGRAEELFDRLGATQRSEMLRVRLRTARKSAAAETQSQGGFDAGTDAERP